MDDIAFKKKYQRYKMRVKLWENDFKKKHGRIPSKYDIREASQEIKDSYKMYYKLKTSFLEDTLNDVLAEDGFDLLEMTQCEEDLTEDQNGSKTELNLNSNCEPQLPLDISSIMENDTSSKKEKFSNLQDLPTANMLTNVVNLHEDHEIKHFDAVNELESNKNAWGRAVSKQQVSETERNREVEIPNTKLKLNLSQQLFKTSSFSKRNPRKLLNRSGLGATELKKQSNLMLTPEKTIEVLPDLETILAQRAKEQQTATVIAACPLLLGNKTNETLNIVDPNWLKRLAAQNGQPIESLQTMVPNKQNASENTNVIYGLRNIDISQLETSIQQPEESQITESTSSDTPTAVAIAKTLNPQEITPLRTSKSDSDSVVSDSEEECAPQEYRHMVKRRRTNAGTIESIKEGENINQENLNTNSLVSINKKTISAEEILTEDETKNSENDFSPDDSDEDFLLEPQPKNARNKSATKRVAFKKTISKLATKTRVRKGKASKMVKVTNEKEDLELQKDQKVITKSIRKKSTTKQITKKETNARHQGGKRTSRVKKGQNEEKTLAEADEEQPPDPEQFKFALALENDSITAVPRVKPTELDLADKVAQNYINNVNTSTQRGSSAATPVVNAKRAAARKKLEEKIAAGKLNENFVTIDIQKKKFVKGKRTINYSRYKKKLWKDKKRIAALSGPNMDMGGCDGGVLRCFQCGEVGHFAQQCKLKGDTLLPLTAELAADPSPFPTLEEAELMAAENAMVAHSRNILKLPKATNAALLRCVEETDNYVDDEDEDDDKKDEEVLTVGPIEEDVQTLTKHKVTLENETDKFFEDDNELEDVDIDSIVASALAAPKISPIKKYVGEKIPEAFLKKIGFDVNKSNCVGALYDLNPDGSVQSVTPEVLEALHMFGHTDFRKGQDRAIMRILSGLSTLVTLSTGSGKSLCYQLPAYLYSRQKKSITLVISPLVSLMEDQVHGVPHFLRAHCLHTNQTPQQRLAVQQKIAAGEVDILLVSPEAVVAGERSTGFGALLRQLPPIAFACIDEAHCVSQWSHNFRPSYLMICKVLKKNLGVNTVLGLTATATLPTRMSIINHLGINDGEKGIISDTPLPDNLTLSISKDENRDTALLQLLCSKRFEPCQSIIIYCTRRDDCERIARFLRTTMQDRNMVVVTDGKRKRKRVNWHVEPYHAGMPASRRRTVQNAFMRNELRIVVATIAFGMGINKPDIRAVIHYNMPRNFESYVQEIGRAGRDGQISHCHLFLDAHGNDQNELRRHIYANSIDRHVIRKLLQHVFVPCACDRQPKSAISKCNQEAKSNQNLNVDASDFGDINLVEVRTHVCPGHEIGFSIDKTVEELDIPAENISTLLCYMELDARWCLNVLSSAYSRAKVISYGGCKYLKYAAKECPPLAMAIALEIKKNNFKDDANIIEFSVIDIAAAIGWNSGVVKYQLKNLEWVEVGGRSQRSPITVNFYDLGFRIKAPGDFISEEIDEALDALYNRAVKQEHTQLIQLQYVSQGLSSVAYNTYIPCGSENFSEVRSDQLKGIIRDYFRNDYPKDLKLEFEPDAEPDSSIESDTHGLLNMYPENNFSGRNVARIFHGISSPNFPAVVWGRCKYWRVHTKCNFNRIVQLANSVIIQRRVV